MNARNLGFPTGSFDLVISGFMGWYDCFDFNTLKYTQPDTKTHEIRRVLKPGGRLVCCSWEEQEDVAWMEAEILHHYPAILNDPEYIARRPIGMAYEKAAGYEAILGGADFREIAISTEVMTFVSRDEEEWWRQMRQVGWESLIDKIETAERTRIKEAIFQDLQPFKQTDGIHFKKTVFFVRGLK
jgi:SAM-dependent methyltransferase